MLAYLNPELPAARFDQMAEEAAVSRVWAGASYPSDVEAGLALGRAVAEQVIAYDEADRSHDTWNGERPPGIGTGPEFWEPAPGSVSPPTQPLGGSWETWALESGSQFWAGGQGTPLPPGIWNQIALDYVRRDQLNTPHSARTFALLNVAQADAGIAAWDTKYTYWTARPVNVIRDLGLDPDWESFVRTPSFPSYTSGHATYSGAAAEVLSYLFPDDADTFAERAEEAAISRLYGGIHFPIDNERGLEMGYQVGAVVVDRAEDDGAGAA